jgi:hypothetical protein
MKIAHWIAAGTMLLASTLSFADQPHMEAALSSLQQAKVSLEKATADKGGHRVKALKAIDQAIAQVQAGIDFDRSHSNKNENKPGK